MSHTFEEVIVTDDGEEMRLNEEGGGMLNMENEKRMRREIANSNERRRMQSINAGFQSLRSLLPHHEGEKLSKAAILQQTAQYIIELEREKTLLLSQNCQLKRLVDQQETSEIHVLKKRKMDPVFTLQTISDSSDEGLGSMSPEPITLMTTANGKTTTLTSAPKEIVELKNLLEAERRQKNALEERLRQIELQIFPDRSRDVAVTYQHQEVIEHTDNVRDDDVTVSIIQEPISKMREMESIVVSMDALPTIGQTQVVVCSHGDDDLVDEDSRTASPCDIEIDEGMVHIKQELTMSSRPDSPIEHTHNKRVQPILEAAIKAEPKVEVERINAPTTAGLIIVNDDKSNSATQKSSIAATSKAKPARSRMYITHNTSRQNLETIVEAIRHLEGDQFVTDLVEQPQEAPLALTNKPQRQLQIEMNPFLQFRSQQNVSTTPSLTSVVTSNNVKSVTSVAVSHLQQQQQSRPGVIVVKQSS
jgi:transcription factor AP-4